MQFIIHKSGVINHLNRFENAISLLYKPHIFQCIGMNIFVEFQIWNSTLNLLPIHRKIQFPYNLRALKFTSSYAFLKRPLDPWSGAISCKIASAILCDDI